VLGLQPLARLPLPAPPPAFYLITPKFHRRLKCHGRNRSGNLITAPEGGPSAEVPTIPSKGFAVAASTRLFRAVTKGATNVRALAGA
jgi:hypothetical protein